MTAQPDDRDHKDILREAREGIRAGNAVLALQLLRDKAAPADNVALQSQYARLAKAMAGQLGELPVMRVAFLANATLGHWVDCLRFWLLLEGFRLEEYIVPFGTWRQQIVDANSDLYKFEPEMVWFFLRAADLHLDVDPAPDRVGNASVVEKATCDISSQVQTVATHLSALCLVNTIVPPANRVFGNFEGANSDAVSTRIQRFNLALARDLPHGTAVFDIAHLAARFGLDRWEDARLWHLSKHPFALDAQGQVAFAAARVLAAAKGRARKCLIVDLDNTLWGGIVGDDGVEGIRIGNDDGAVGEAHAAFQTWLKALANRGIALAVCSKNDIELAREPFLRKEGMVLKLEDFVSFKANWDNKADNIRAIARDLNLGLEAFVFVDDNPAERALVRRELPQVAVPELPSDPADYVSALAAGSWFETLAITREDLSRVRTYRENATRTEAQYAATDLNSYLGSLEMRSKWDAVDGETLQRATQLVNKTNQFHLTNTRYTEAQIKTLAASPESWVGQFSLADRFGDHGIIAVVVLRFLGGVAAIDTWVMSCRVFSRQMEDFTFGVIWRVAKERKCERLTGVFVPTRKNAIVARLYEGFGGTRMADSDGSDATWTFELQCPDPAGTSHIKDISLDTSTP